MFVYAVSAQKSKQKSKEKPKQSTREDQKYLQTKGGKISKKNNSPESSPFIGEKQSKRSAVSDP